MFGAGCLMFGAGCLVFGVGCLVLDVWCWMFGAWYLMVKEANLNQFISKGDDMIDNFIWFIIQVCKCFFCDIISVFCFVKTGYYFCDGADWIT